MNFFLLKLLLRSQKFFFFFFGSIVGYWRGMQYNEFSISIFSIYINISELHVWSLGKEILDVQPKCSSIYMKHNRN